MTCIICKSWLSLKWEMTKGMSTVKITKKNQGIDIGKGCINCQYPQKLTEVTRTQFTAPFKLFLTCSVIMTNRSRSMKIIMTSRSRSPVSSLQAVATRSNDIQKRLCRMTREPYCPKKDILVAYKGKARIRKTTLGSISDFWAFCWILYISKTYTLCFSPTWFEEVIQSELDHINGFIF